jgi:hypothetical protein
VGTSQRTYNVFLLIKSNGRLPAAGCQLPRSFWLPAAASLIILGSGYPAPQVGYVASLHLL